MSLISLVLSRASIYKIQLCLERNTCSRPSQLLCPHPWDTHIVGFPDQPLLIVQNVPDAADQLHGAAVIRVLKESKGSYQWPPSAPTMPVAVPCSPLPGLQPLPQFSLGSLRNCHQTPLSLLDLISPPRTSFDLHCVRNPQFTKYFQSTISFYFHITEALQHKRKQ